MVEYTPQWTAQKNSGNTLSLAGAKSAKSPRATPSGTFGTANLGGISEKIPAPSPLSERQLVRQAIVSEVTKPRGEFSRERYDQFWAEYNALPDPKDERADLEAQLETGWQWLQSHPDHPGHEPFLDRWMARLRQYEQAYADSGAQR